MSHKPVCLEPACSNFQQPMKRHNSDSLWYCGGHMISGNYYAVLGDLMTFIMAANHDKDYPKLSYLLNRAAAQTDLILEFEHEILSDNEQASLHEQNLAELDDSGDRI